MWELNHLLARLTVGEVMTKTVIVADPEREASEVAAIMLSAKIDAVPVLCGGEVVGIVTATDFLHAFLDTPALVG